jgi:phosphatidyl-myo-inositol dimannoside synthase
MTAIHSDNRVYRVIGLFPDLLGPGGVQQAGRLMTAALTEIAGRRGWQLDFLSLNDPLGIHEFRFGGTSIPFRGFGRAKGKFVYFALASARKGSTKDHRTVLAAHPNLAVPAAWMRNAASGLRIMVVSHGIEVWRPLAPDRQRALKKASLVTAPSSYTAQKLAEIQGLTPDKIRRVPWPLDPDFLKLAEAPQELRLPPAFPRGRVVLSVGRWAAAERYKGADELIRATSRLCGQFSDLQLALAGTGDDLSRLRSIAAESGQANRIHFLEGLSREELAASYAHADLFALPSTGEGFGLVFLEAMAFAKPVIGVAAGGITDLIEDGRNGLLLKQRDEAELTEAIGSLLRDDALRREMGRRGAEKVRAEFLFEPFRDAIERIHAELCRAT